MRRWFHQWKVHAFCKFHIKQLLINRLNICPKYSLQLAMNTPNFPDLCPVVWLRILFHTNLHLSFDKLIPIDLDMEILHISCYVLSHLDCLLWTIRSLIHEFNLIIDKHDFSKKFSIILSLREVCDQNL